MTMERLENGYKEKSITVTLAAQSDFVSEKVPIIPMILRTHRIPVTPAIPETRENSDNSGNSGFFDGFWWIK